MSTVATSIFPNTTLKLNELEARVQPAGVHPKSLMRLCNQQEVSSLTELRQALPRCIWPQLRAYTEDYLAYMPLFFDGVAAGIAKYAPPVPLTNVWNGVPQHNVFRIAIILTDPPFLQFATEELLREQDDYWARLMRSRLEYYADIVEGILLYRLLVERSVPLLGLPQSLAGVMSALVTGIMQAEPGTENVYFMLDSFFYALALRQSPPRLNLAGYIVLNQETPRFNIIPVAIKPLFGSFTNYTIGYSDYLVKTTTRYYLNKFRIDSNKRSATDRNLYKVMYERYVSYEFPIFTASNNTCTWAFRIDSTSAANAVVADDLGGPFNSQELSAIVNALITPY